MRKMYLTSSCAGAYQVKTQSNCFRKSIDDIHSWVEPFCQPFVGSLGQVESMDLLMKDGENGAGRVASLQLGGKWVREEIVFCYVSVCLQGIIKD
jgi:hypothetical protein